MSYASPIDISNFAGFEPQKRKLSECIFALDIGGSLAKLAYQTPFRYKVCIPKGISDLNSKHKTTVCGPFEFYDYHEHEYEGHKLCFVKFETRFIEACIDYIRDTIMPSYGDSDIDLGRLVGRVTGGGAFMYIDIIKGKLPDISIERVDEMESLIRGCSFLLRNIPDEVFIYDKRAKPSQIFLSSCMVETYPLLLVNIGSGVSFLKVESDSKHTRVGGTSLGGGTFWGIGVLLSGAQPSFDKLLDMADEGDHRNVDMLVRDIYGGAYESLGLAENVIASSFGLAARRPHENRRPADLIKALLIAICNNIGQLACLYANLNDVRRIVFGGFFIRGHALTMEVISFAVNYWSKGKIKAMFLRHEGYLGAVGAFTKSLAFEPASTSSSSCWAESYISGSSSFATVSRRWRVSRSLSVSTPVPLTLSPTNAFADAHSWASDPENSSTQPLKPTLTTKTKIAKSEEMKMSQLESDTDLRQSAQPSTFSQSKLPVDATSDSIEGLLEYTEFELERLAGVSLEIFPLLLSPADYVPDTWDLTQDTNARVYWLECFKQGVDRMRQKAGESQVNTKVDAIERANQFAERYTDFLNELSICPSGRGVLTVRCILEAQQHFLREFGFPDAFCHQKKLENSLAISAFPDVIDRLRGLNWNDRQLSLIKGVLTGNIFDWGASEAVRFFMRSQQSVEGMASFDQTMAKLPPRPWLMDDFDRWMKRISVPEKRPHCVLIFCDNSGADFILGILPFAIEFLKSDCKVILTANSVPAINDVTYPELLFILNQVAALDSTLSDALTNGRLIFVDNGQTSPCLDLRRISNRLARLVIEEAVDLIVIEGMGRAVHTNLYARFRVDCLKIAVIKNSWLASRLGGDLFSVMFKYEKYSTDGPSCGYPLP